MSQGTGLTLARDVHVTAVMSSRSQHPLAIATADTAMSGAIATAAVKAFGADHNLVRRRGDPQSSGRERFSLCEPRGEPPLYFVLYPSHRVGGDANTHREATLSL